MNSDHRGAWNNVSETVGRVHAVSSADWLRVPFHRLSLLCND